VHVGERGCILVGDMPEVLLFFSLSNKIARLYSTFDNVIQFVNDTAYRISWLVNKLVSNATSRKAILRAIFTKDFPF
jgi:hypothetical protein